MKKTIIAHLFLLLPLLVCAQPNLTPASPQDTPLLLIGGIAHLGNGKVVPNAAIAFTKGKIEWVKTAERLTNAMKDGYQVVEVNPKAHIYPGFIAPNTVLGLREIEAVRATNDHDEVGSFNPNVRSIIAYNTDSRVIPTVRSNGILMAQTTPKGGIISGSSSLVQLDAWNWEDAVLKVDDGIHLNWPALYRYRGWWAEPGDVEPSRKYQENVKQIEVYFEEARAYAQKDNQTVRNLKFEAMRELFEEKRQLFIHVNNVKGIKSAVLFAKQFGIQPVIVGGRDAWMITDFLKEEGVSIVLQQPHSLPHLMHTYIDQTFRTPAVLHEAGIPFCFSMGGFWEQRNLPFQAGQAVAYGLPYEAAVACLTAQTAQILRLENCGTLTEGMDATLIVSLGDALDVRTNQIVHAFIQGREIDLDDKQKMLYRKYRDKYNRE